MMGFAAIAGRWLLGKIFSLGRLLRAAWEWLTEKPVRVLIAALLVVIAVQYLTIGKRTEERDQARGDFSAEVAAHEETIDNYARARVEAERLQGLRNQRVTQQQAQINERVSHDYETRLADARARYDRLRQQLLAQASGSGAGSAVLPAAGQGSARAAQASGDHGLPAEGTCPVEMSLHERFVATEQAIQLDALIHWVEAQGAVDVNADPAGR